MTSRSGAISLRGSASLGVVEACVLQGLEHQIGANAKDAKVATARGVSEGMSHEGLPTPAGLPMVT